jgi:hypothetical protein
MAASPIVRVDQRKVDIKYGTTSFSFLVQDLYAVALFRSIAKLWAAEIWTTHTEKYTFMYDKQEAHAKDFMLKMCNELDANAPTLTYWALSTLEGVRAIIINKHIKAVRTLDNTSLRVTFPGRHIDIEAHDTETRDQYFQSISMGMNLTFDAILDSSRARLDRPPKRDRAE